MNLSAAIRADRLVVLSHEIRRYDSHWDPFLLTAYDGDEVRFFRASGGKSSLSMTAEFLSTMLNKSTMVVGDVGTVFVGGPVIDLLFVVGALHPQRQKYGFYIYTKNSHIVGLDVWLRSPVRGDGYWAFRAPSVSGGACKARQRELFGPPPTKDQWLEDPSQTRVEGMGVDHPFWPWLVGQEVVAKHFLLMERVGKSW